MIAGEPKLKSDIKLNFVLVLTISSHGLATSHILDGGNGEAGRGAAPAAVSPCLCGGGRLS